MNEFKNALGAVFGVEPVEVPELAIDQIDGWPGSGSAEVVISICRADQPVLLSVSPCVVERPPVAASICRAESPEQAAQGPVAAIAE